MKWFEIKAELIPKLRELQKKDSNYEIVKSEDAVVMFYGMGDPLYLTFDGRVIIEECFMEEKGSREAETLAEVAMAVVVGAKVRDFSELLSILPDRPKNAVGCENCGKSGWLQPAPALGAFVCGECGGLGWKIDLIYTITDWYDGAREGIASFNGEPHYYKCEWDEGQNNYAETYQLQKIDDETFMLVIEDWNIWLEWEKAFNKGETTQETHPTLPKDKDRHKILQKILKRKLVLDKDKSFRAKAEFTYGKPTLVKWKIV